MLSLRLQAIAEEIADNQKVIDIGTDHAYLPIYLVKERFFTNVAATDKSLAVLEYSRANIEKYHLDKQIKLILSDGFAQVKENYDVAVIAGMGAHTITDIIKNSQNLPEYLIIQSNNNLPFLRRFMEKKEYKIIKEKVVYEKGKYYIIIKYQKGKEILTADLRDFGKNYDKKYLQALLKKNQANYLLNKDESLAKIIKRLQKFIEKIPD